MREFVSPPQNHVWEMNQKIQKIEQNLNTLQDAENNIQKTEATRENNEKIRQDNEKSRTGAETKRVSAEASRVQAETQRVNAETERESQFSSTKTACEVATTNANNAATSANTAAANAKADYVGTDNYVYHWDSESSTYKKTDLYVKGDKGAKGDSVYTGDTGQLVVVNDLVSGGAEKALSAEQGKILAEKININTMVYNVSAANNGSAFTLESAIAAIPEPIKKVGLIISFLKESDNKDTISKNTLVTYLFNGDTIADWTNKTKWINLSDKILKNLLENATFAGIATPTTNPGTPDGNVFYIATEAGIYANFSNITVGANEVAILVWNGGATWEKEVSGLVSSSYLMNEVAKLEDADKEIKEELASQFKNKNISTRYVNTAFSFATGKYISKSTKKLVYNGGFRVTNEIKINKGETIYNNNIGTYGLIGILKEEDLPLTEETVFNKVIEKGSSYTATEDNEYFVASIDSRSTPILELVTTTDDNISCVELKKDISTLAQKLNKTKEEIVSISSYGAFYLYDNEDGTYRSLGLGDGILTTPIKLKAGDILSVEPSNVVFGFIPNGEEQTLDTIYGALPSGKQVIATDDMLICMSFTSANKPSLVKIIRKETSLIEDYRIYNDIASSSVIKNKDSDICLIMGSSLTYSGYSPKTLSWIERVNDLVDIGIVNGGHSGGNLSSNITDLKTKVIIPGFSGYQIAPRYIISNNNANGTPTGKSLDIQLKEFKSVADNIGAKMLVGGEEPTLTDYKAYDIQCNMTMNGKNHYKSATMWHNMNSSQNYKGWIDGSMSVHGNFKNGSALVTIYEMIKDMYISKSIKYYKVRENYKDGNPDLSDLVYSNNFERALIWRAICPGIGNIASPQAQDSIDGNGYIDAITGISKMAEEEQTNKSCEVLTAKDGGAVTFYKHALIEIIVPKIGVTNANISFETGSAPDNVGYIIKGAYTEAEFSYENGVVSLQISNVHYEDYDKFKLVVSNTTNDKFSISNVVVDLFDGKLKTSDEHYYLGRREGVELMSKTSVESGWKMNGNALVKSLPIAVRNYTILNNIPNHIQLDDDKAYATYEQTLPKTVHKVAVRIAASIFPKIQTTRTSNEYTTTKQNIFLGMYYGGDLEVTINGAYTKQHIEVGWLETYQEIVIDDNKLSIKIGRLLNIDSNMNVGTFPVFIHNVSIQEIS